jgi:hypothetical protein
MPIDGFAFGKMKIDGTVYRSDLCVHPDGRVVDGWWRRSGHGLCAADLADLIAQSPETILIGTGIYGRLKPDPNLVADLAARGIDLVSAPNAEAVALFNRLWGRCRLAAGFHLTC